MKIRTWLSNDFDSFKSNVGNGKAIPQFELDKKTMMLKPKLDKDGNRVYHSLFNDIQLFKDVNSLEKILGLGNLEDLTILDSRCATEQEARAKSVDLTGLASAEEMKVLENKLNSMGMSLDDLKAAYINLLKQNAKKQADSAAAKKQAEENLGNKDEKENKK